MKSDCADGTQANHGGGTPEVYRQSKLCLAKYRAQSSGVTRYRIYLT
jgi:hypothetical protein